MLVCHDRRHASAGLRTQQELSDRCSGVLVYAGRDSVTGNDRRLRKTCATYTEAAASAETY